MKTTTIIFLLILGFGYFYVSNPDIYQLPAIALCGASVFVIGLQIGRKAPKHLKTDEEIDKIASMAVKDVAAVAMDNVNCRLKIIELESDIRQLKNAITNREMLMNKNKKQVAGLKDDLKKANTRIQELQNPIIQETC